MSAGIVFPLTEPLMSGSLQWFVVRDQHPVLLDGVLEVDLVIRALREDLNRADDIPAALPKRLDECSLDVFVGVPREATGHYWEELEAFFFRNSAFSRSNRSSHSLSAFSWASISSGFS